MPADDKGVTQQSVSEFGDKLAAWAAGLDDVEKAMLKDLLAKAGGDVFGNEDTQLLMTPDGKDADASSLSPLELDSYADAVRGIFEPT